MYGDDILSVVFLAFVCIVVAGVMNKLLPQNAALIVPVMSLICVSLWMAYDFMLLKRHSTKCTKPKPNELINDLIQEADILSIEDDISREVNKDSVSKDSVSKDSVSKEVDIKKDAIEELNTRPNISITNTYNKIHEPRKQGNKDFDIDYYNHNADIRDIHGEMGFTGDTRIYNRMKYMGLQPQLAKNIRASWNARTLQPWVEEELREQEERNWLAEEEDRLYDGML